jgi:hypothetical protein
VFSRTAAAPRTDVLVDELNIVTFEFSRAFNDAIEAKQVAAQRVQQ